MWLGKEAKLKLRQASKDYEKESVGQKKKKNIRYFHSQNKTLWFSYYEDLGYAYLTAQIIHTKMNNCHRVKSVYLYRISGQPELRKSSVGETQLPPLWIPACYVSMTINALLHL